MSLAFARSIAALLLGALGSLVSFGLLLALLWAPASESSRAYQIWTSIASASLAFVAAGIVSVR
jgi:hypothetical protein